MDPRDARPFEPEMLLEAARRLDDVRARLRDQDEVTPPQLRIDLLKLHGLAADVAKYGEREKLRALFNLALNARVDVTVMIEHLQRVQHVLDQIVTDVPIPEPTP